MKEIYKYTELMQLPYGTVVIDRVGDAWQHNALLDRWIVVGIDDASPYVPVKEYLPMKVVYTPDGA